MNYTDLAKQLLNDMFQFKAYDHQRKIDESMRGEVFVLLHLLEKNTCILPSEISEEMNISSARVTTILNSLENKGLITREIDKNDRRKIIVNLTNKGRKKAKNNKKIIVSLTSQILEFLGENDSKELVRITHRLIDFVPKSIL